MALSKKWIGHIEAWQGSGLAQADYCRQQEVNPKTFVARLCEYRRGQPALPPPALIPVQVETAAQTALVLPHTNGHRLELPPGVSAAWLAELWRCLG
ncbi:MAG: IS66 family insertion sequence element accessory protein TnpB [Methylococcales bacterium]|nr:IS66 family insertion sequence element accessory protein TnpB [Methylococcales bacterium]